jgi:membrane-associated phospholipid phosphatase
MSRLPAIPRRFFRLELRIADTIIGCFILLLSVLEIVFRSNVNGWQILVVKNAIVLLAVFGALWGIQNISSNLLQSLSRILGYSMIISFIYREMGSIIHIFFLHWLDPRINSVEFAVFGWYPTEWFQTIARPWLNELMMFAYVIYGLLIPVAAFFCYKMGKKEGLERYLTELTLTNILCYVCYILLPVAGPSRSLPPGHPVPMDGLFFTSLVELMKTNFHLPGGAFPSAHCAVSTVMLAAVYRNHRRVGLAFSPLVLLIYVSTVYGRFHYVTDVLGGISTALFALWAAPKLQSAFGCRLVQWEFSWRRALTGLLAKNNVPIPYLKEEQVIR